MCWKCGRRWRSTIAARHADRVQRPPLEAATSIARRLGDEVHLHVEQRAGEVLDRLETLVEASRRLQLVDQRLGHRLAGAIMAGEAAQRLGPLDSQCSNSCEGSSTKSRATAVPESERIGDVRQHAVQPVAELVEQGPRVVEADQARLAGAAGREIHLVDDDRQDASVELLLVAVARSSRRRCACQSRAKLSPTNSADRRAVAAQRRPDARRPGDRSHVVARDEGDAEQAMGRRRRRRAIIASSGR